MTSRELRNCTEMLRALGFPRMVSIENFRTPNFELVAEILYWVVQRFEPESRIPSDIDTEHDRVIFIRSVAEFLANKTNVRLNTKKLYQADGFAVQEIIKVLSILYDALQSNDIDEDKDQSNDVVFNFDVSNKLSDMKQIRALASTITAKGATLYDLLKREVDLRDNRNSVINRQFELVEVENELKSAIKSVENETAECKKTIENVGNDETAIDSKIEKKKISLERSEKRLGTLKKVRPAFMDEYENLEEELKKNYEIFTRRFLNLAFLENNLEEQEKQALEKKLEREAVKKSSEKLHGGGGLSAMLDGGETTDEDEEDSDDSDDDSDDVLEISEEKIKRKTTNDSGKQRGPNRNFANLGKGKDEEIYSFDSDLDFNLGMEAPESDFPESDIANAFLSKESRPNNSIKIMNNIEPEDDF